MDTRCKNNKTPQDRKLGFSFKGQSRRPDRRLIYIPVLTSKTTVTLLSPRHDVVLTMTTARPRRPLIMAIKSRSSVVLKYNAAPVLLAPVIGMMCSVSVYFEMCVGRIMIILQIDWNKVTMCIAMFAEVSTTLFFIDSSLTVILSKIRHTSSVTYFFFLLILCVF